MSRLVVSCFTQCNQFCILSFCLFHDLKSDVVYRRLEAAEPIEQADLLLRRRVVIRQSIVARTHRHQR